MTLKEKWDNLISEVNRRQDEFIAQHFDRASGTFYIIHPSGKIQESFVIGMTVNVPFKTYLLGKKPTKKEVEELEANLSASTEFDKDKVYVTYYYIWDPETERRATTAISANDFFSGKVFFDRAQAELKSAEVTREFEAQNAWYALHKKDANYDYGANGYKFLGWQNGWRHLYFDGDGNVTEDLNKRKSFGYLTSDYPEYGKCRDLGHRRIEVRHNNRGSENTVSCPICKIYWKYDCSD